MEIRSERPFRRQPNARHPRGLAATDSSFAQPDSVYKRITSIIGVEPNRSELTALVNALSLIPLGRSEKRVKALLIQRLEEARDTILPFLQTRQGMGSLERAYLDIVHHRPSDASAADPESVRVPLPPEATVEFYLNKPRKAELPSE
jgi:hypothetical protein